MYTVGDTILGGKVVIASVDAYNLILSVSIPSLHDINGNALTITYNGGVTEQFIQDTLGGKV